MKLYPNVTIIFIIWSISVLIVAYLGFSALPHSGYFSNNFWESFRNWDGGHFIGIAEIGYSQKFQYAFFPLYPLAIKTVSFVTQNYYVAAILISVVATFFGLHFLYGLILLDFKKETAEKVIMAFLFFPTSFFLLAAYSEGLFFFLTVATFFLYRKNHFFWAALTAALASATRLVGLAIIVSLIIEILIHQGFNRRNFYILFAPLGFLAYCIFLYQQTNDPFYFIVAEDHWQRILTPLGIGFWEAIKNISNGIITSNFNTVIDLIFAVFGLGFAIRSFRFLSPSYAIYSLISVSIPLFTPTLSSIPRFLLVIFPIFILIAFLKNRFFQLSFQILSIMMLAIFSAIFFTGYWIS